MTHFTKANLQLLIINILSPVGTVSVGVAVVAVVGIAVVVAVGVGVAVVSVESIGISLGLGLGISGPLAVVSDSEGGDGGDGDVADLVADLGGGDNVRLDGGHVGDGAHGGEGGHSGGQGGGGVGEAGVGQTAEDDLGLGLALLSLLGSGGSSGGGGVESGLELSLGGGNLGGVLHVGEGVDGGDEGGHLGGGGGAGSHGQVGAGNPEAVDGVGDVVDGLEEAVGVHVLVAAGGHTEGVPGLGLGRGTAGVTERELSELILSVELGGRSGVDSPGDASNKHLGACGAYAGC